MFMRNARVSHGQSLKAEFINQFAGEDAVFRVRILKHATWTWHIKGLGSSSVLKIAGDLLFALGNITARELQLNTKNNPIIGFKYAVTVRKSVLLSVDPFSIVSPKRQNTCDQILGFFSERSGISTNRATDRPGHMCQRLHANKSPLMSFCC